MTNRETVALTIAVVAAVVAVASCVMTYLHRASTKERGQ